MEENKNVNFICMCNYTAYNVKLRSLCKVKCKTLSIIPMSKENLLLFNVFKNNAKNKPSNLSCQIIVYIPVSKNT